ncbi:hypothetical protein GCM10027347_47480 [Larkinella harenae]
MLWAALGRAIQMRIFGPVPPSFHLALEIVVESARIMTVLVIIGHGNIQQGVRKSASIMQLKKKEWRAVGQAIRTNFRLHWANVFIHLMVFSLLAFGFNRLNDWIANHSAVFYGMKDFGIIHEQATPTPLFFFLKNLTVIPFTLLFEYGLFRWLAGQMAFDTDLIGAKP